MQDIWGCRYVDKSFIDDFLRNKDNPDYKRLIMVLREFMSERYIEYPELIEVRPVEGALRRAKVSKDAKLITSYVTLMENREQRERVMGMAMDLNNIGAR